jgi:ribose 5-phosphate isomerase B
MKIAIGSDHAGFTYKERIKTLLISLGHEVRDFGTDSAEAVDYPKFIRPTAEAVAKGECGHRARRLGEWRGDRGE